MSYVRGPGVGHWHSIDTINDGLLAPQGAISPTMTSPTADMAIYVPVIVRQRVIVRKLWFGNANTATGNYDLGLYDAAGVQLLARGSTAKPATSAEVIWDCTDTTLGPGLYYLAFASSNTTDTFCGIAPAAPICTAIGLYTEASALPLPATATFALNHTLAVYPVLGMFLTTVA